MQLISNQNKNNKKLEMNSSFEILYSQLKLKICYIYMKWFALCEIFLKCITR